METSAGSGTLTRLKEASRELRAGRMVQEGVADLPVVQLPSQPVVPVALEPQAEGASGG